MQGITRGTGAALVAVAMAAGALLGVIGLRYLLVPESAARTFGLPGHPVGHELYYVIGLRNLWLAALAMALAGLRQWQGLAAWFGIGSLVCFSDALLAATATGRLPQVAFHVVCGLVCPLLALACWRQGAAR